MAGKAIVRKLDHGIKQIELHTNCTILGQKGHDVGHVTHWLTKILGALVISWTGEATNFKFVEQIDYKE